MENKSEQQLSKKNNEKDTENDKNTNDIKSLLFYERIYLENKNNNSMSNNKIEKEVEKSKEKEYNFGINDDSLNNNSLINKNNNEKLKKSFNNINKDPNINHSNIINKTDTNIDPILKKLMDIDNDEQENIIIDNKNIENIKNEYNENTKKKDYNKKKRKKNGLNELNLSISNKKDKLIIFDNMEDDNINKDNKNIENKIYKLNVFTSSNNNKTNKEQNNSLSEEIEKSNSKILEEINKNKEDLTNNYKEEFFNDENNYVLPDLDIIKRYPIILINFDQNEEEDNYSKNLENYLNDEQKLDLLMKKQLMLPKAIEIENYVKNDHFKKFLELFGDIPFFEKIDYKDNISYINIDDKKVNNKFEIIENSFVGKIDYFINLLYKYKIYKKDENDSELKLMDCLIAMKHDFNIETNNSLKNEYVLFYRKVLNDGNSFFRAFIFALIEGYILKNNLSFVNLINMMKIITFEYKKKIKVNSNYSRCITRLEEIFTYFKNGKFQNALELFYNSFSLNNKYFDEYLIIFVKFILYFCKKKDLNNFNPKLIEFEFYDLILLPYIFNVSIEISLDIKMGKNNFIIFDAKNLTKNSQTIQLCFYKNNTFIYYSLDKYTKLLEYKIQKQKNELPKINKIIYKLEDKINCEQCNKKTTHIAFIEKRILICELCLNIYYENNINKRINSLIEKYINLDIFFRKVVLSKDKYLEDYEYLHIYNESFCDVILRKLIDYINVNNCWICSKCKIFKRKVKKLKCGCSYCRECHIDIIKKMTNEYFLLNPYEKKYIRKVRCLCGNNMDIISVIEEEEKNNENIELYYSMIERFNQYIKSLCMNCELKLLDNNKGKINVLNNKNKMINENHVLCSKCMESLKINGNNKNVFCKICSENHKISIDFEN